MVEAFVYIVESSRPDDLQNGDVESEALGASLKLCKIPFCVNTVSNRSEFATALNEELIGQIKEFRRPPILHFSTHGNEFGIELGDLDFIRWDELRLLLQPVIDFMKGSLLICMSSCCGASGAIMAMHDDEGLLFGTLIGNTKGVKFADAVIAYQSFYRLFFQPRHQNSWVNFGVGRSDRV
ncbi:MAG: hypothetical protein EXS05_16845 [Planctomycetaceae bacterium]|nr:hypothetical protein [Planctomycetaceae bacterium]